MTVYLESGVPPPGAPEVEPTLVRPLPDISLADNLLAERRINLDDYFANATRYGVTRAGSSVSAAVENRELILHPLEAGDTTVRVLAYRGGLSISDSFTATVVGAVPLLAPTLEQALPDRNVQNSALEELEINLDAYFAGAVSYAVAVTGAAVTAAVSESELTVTPAAIGNATVRITATNPQGAVSDEFNVSVTDVPPVVIPPQVTTEFPDLTLENTPIAQQRLDLNDYFSGATRYLYSAEGASVAVGFAAGIDGHILLVSAVAEGETTVIVTAQNSAGSVSDTFRATVLGPPIPLPSIDSPIEDVDLFSDDNDLLVVLAAVFSDAEEYEAQSSDPDVATAHIDPVFLRVHPVTPGDATISVTARNARGAVQDSFIVAVAQRVARPVVTTPLPDRTVMVGAPAFTVNLNDFFEGATSYTVQLGSAGTNRAVIAGQFLAVYPTDRHTGDSRITVTARNSRGTVQDSFILMVEPQSNAPPTVAVELPDIIQATGSPPRFINLDNHFNGVTTYNVTVVGLGVVAGITGRTLDLSAPTALSSPATIEILGANSAGQIRDEFTVQVIDPPASQQQFADFEIRLLALRPGFRSFVLTQYFTGADSYAVTTTGDAVRAVLVGATLFIAPVRTGAGDVTVTAENAVGRAAQTFTVTVSIA